MSEPIPLCRPEITDDDLAAIAEAARGDRVRQGDAARRLEEEVARRLRRPFAIGTGSLGTGLRIALEACGIGPGAEVVVPAFAPVAVANAVVFTGARPIFADADPRTLNLSARTVEPLLTDRTRAIVASANFGNLGGVLELAHLATKWEIPLIENATETFGGSVGRDQAGCFGRIAAIGFPASGPVFASDAAVLVTNDDTLAAACRSLRDVGRPFTDPEEGLPAEVGRLFEHERLGFDSRLDDLRGALGASQLARIDETVARLAALAERYVRRLGGHPDLVLPTLPEGSTVAWPGFTLRLGDTYGADDRDGIIRGLHRHDIGASNPYPVIPRLPCHTRLLPEGPIEFPVAERIAQRTISLPFHIGLSARDLDLTCQTLEVMIRRQTFRR